MHILSPTCRDADTRLAMFHRQADDTLPDLRKTNTGFQGPVRTISYRSRNAAPNHRMLKHQRY